MQKIIETFKKKKLLTLCSWQAGVEWSPWPHLKLHWKHLRRIPSHKPWHSLKSRRHFLRRKEKVRSGWKDRNQKQNWILNPDFKTEKLAEYLQDISQDTHGPHVCVEPNGFAFDDFRCGKLCCARRDFNDVVGIEFCSQTKIYQFYVGAASCLAHNVLGFDVCKKSKLNESTAFHQIEFVRVYFLPKWMMFFSCMCFTASQICLM